MVSMVYHLPPLSFMVASMSLFDAPLTAPSPSVLPPPTEENPRPHPVWPGWVWWYGPYGHPRARCGGVRVDARDFRELDDRIREAEGGHYGGSHR